MKTVKLVSTNRSTSTTIETTASTWGELREDIQMDSNMLPPDNYRVVIKETRTDLVQDDAALPDEDFTLWISQKKVKSGAKSLNQIVENTKNQLEEHADTDADNLNSAEQPVDPDVLEAQRELG